MEKVFSTDKQRTMNESCPFWIKCLCAPHFLFGRAEDRLRRPGANPGSKNSVMFPH